MKTLITYSLCFCCTFALVAQEAEETGNVSYRTGEAAGFASKDSTALSMMGWGVILAAGIATLCALLTDSSSSSH